jgi:hypothetical protein
MGPMETHGFMCRIEVIHPDLEGMILPNPDPEGLALQSKELVEFV